MNEMDGRHTSMKARSVESRPWKGHTLAKSGSTIMLFLMLIHPDWGHVLWVPSQNIQSRINLLEPIPLQKRAIYDHFKISKEKRKGYNPLFRNFWNSTWPSTQNKNRFIRKLVNDSLQYSMRLHKLRHGYLVNTIIKRGFKKRKNKRS